MSASVPARPSVVQSESVLERVRIHSEFQIPADCDEFTIYEKLKRTLQDSYSSSPWFWVEFRGYGTQQWILDVRLNIGAKIIQRSFRRKFRAQILDSLKVHLSHDQFCSFEKEFNKNRKALQIEEDVAPFTEDKPHSWTRDGLPDDGPATASIPAPSVAALLPTGSGPADGSSGRVANALLHDRPAAASTAALLPAGSGPTDGSSGRVAPPASPPLTGMRRPRASPPAQDKPGPPGSANKTAPKTPRTSETTGAAHRELEFGAGGPAGRGPAASGGPEPYQSHVATNGGLGGRPRGGAPPPEPASLGRPPLSILSELLPTQSLRRRVPP
jgi:hypothetical protein